MENLKTYKNILMFLFLILLCTVFYFKYQNLNYENSALKLKISELTISMERLKKNNFSKEHLIEEQSKLLAKNKNTNAVTSKINIDASNSDEYLYQNEEIGLVKVKLNETSIPFDDQDIDHDWAILVENSITDAFLSHQYLGSYNLENVECRTTQCELTLSNVSIDVGDAAMTVLFAFKDMEVLNEQTKSFKRGHRLDDGTLKISLGRYKNSVK